MPSPQSIGTALRAARRALRSGDSAGAERLFREVLTRFPGNRAAREGLRTVAGNPADKRAEARRLLVSGAFGAAEPLWAELARQPEDAEAGLALAECRLGLGRPDDALNAVDRLLDACPALPAALDLRGRCLRDLGRVTEAANCHRAALGHGSADAGPLNHLGILALAQDDRPAAAAYFRQALVLAPASADLHHNLSRAITYHPGEPHLADLRAQARRAGADPAQAPLHFALFRALDDLGERDEAFGHLVTANRLRKAWLGYDITRDIAVSGAVMKLCADLPPLPDEPPPGPRVIFVTGLPRSGTTLVERILAGSPGVRPCGELSIVTTAAARLLRETQARGEGHVAPDVFRTFREEVRAGLHQRAEGQPIVVDKMPLNFRWLGLVLAALPEARAVHLHRNPMAVGWSLYRHMFGGRGNGFAHDVVDIAAFMRLAQEMTAAWSTRFEPRLLSLDYATLTSEPEQAIRRLIGDLGLDWSEDCLTPHHATGAVLTASAAQVRQPIRPGHDTAWHAYAPQLRPLATALTAAGLVQISPS
ncbi:tetratricopeptide repeat-containing sulfotransferase family protein [Albibacillus kandeliae]|uniref:tetratricopeptide repeat-containing sulfotransferase family protein n=1 Tax=Albibacillus kandeliae TaxID=2174228 RepID=UPI00130094EC|nr:sulfotransferase [Albibacillus kandeliae]